VKLLIFLVLSLNIPQFYAKQAFCSEKSLRESLLKPTTFCTVIGAVRHYMYYSLSFWWLFTFGNVWWITVFPTRGTLFFLERRRIHVMQSIVAWGAPIIGVTVVILTVGYSPSPAFPYVCYTESVNLFYYLLALPEQIFTGISSTLLIWTCYSLSKQIKRRSHMSVNRLQSIPSRNIHVDLLQTIQRQLLVVLIVHAVAVIFSMTLFSSVMLKQDLIQGSFKKYLLCAHLTPRADCIQIFRKFALPELMLVADFVWQAEAAISPTIFILAYKELRNFWLSIFTCGRYPRKAAMSTAQSSRNRAANNVAVARIDTTKM
jgi:hypothetical protein